MSSMPAACAPRVVADASSGQAVVQWILPAGARGFLAASLIIVALGLAFASYSVPGASGGSVVALPDLLIDLNTAPAPVLETLPHVGQTLVRQLVAAREIGPLTSLDETAARVRGIGPGTVARLRPYLRFRNSAAASVESHIGSDLDRTDGKKHTPVRKKYRSPKPTATTLQARLVAQHSE
jgi:hypothetical protein